MQSAKSILAFGWKVIVVEIIISMYQDSFSNIFENADKSDISL